MEQFYKLHTGEAAHFQDMWNKIPIRLYSPGKSHTGQFLTLVNQHDANFVDKIEWKMLKMLRSAAAMQGDNWHSPGTSQDYRFCGLQNSSADGSPRGIPVPRMKEGTTNPTIANAFKVVSKAALQLQPDVFDSLDNRAQSEFVERIHPQNRLTLARESETCLDFFCGIHNNQSTNSHIIISVFGASVIRDGVRYSFNVQHKRSIDAYCNCLAESQDLMQ